MACSANARANALGSVMEITDASQAEAASLRYTPYGEMTITRGGTTQTSDPLGQHWGFTSRFHDEESRLTLFRARYEASATGNFVERDPLEYHSGPALYEYVRSSPVCVTDPLGLEPSEGDAKRVTTDLETLPVDSRDTDGRPPKKGHCGGVCNGRAIETIDITLIDYVVNLLTGHYPSSNSPIFPGTKQAVDAMKFKTYEKGKDMADNACSRGEGDCAGRCYCKSTDPVVWPKLDLTASSFDTTLTLYFFFEYTGICTFQASGR